MPINEIPFEPTHDDYLWKKYVTTDTASTSTAAGTFATYNTSSEEIARLKRELEEEKSKRIQAELEREVAKVRLENHTENKKADEDEIERLTKQVALDSKIMHKITFIIADSATTTTSYGNNETKYRGIIAQITSALKTSDGS